MSTLLGSVAVKKSELAMRCLEYLYRSRYFRRMRPFARLLKGRVRSLSRVRILRSITASKAWPPNWSTSLKAARVLIGAYGHLESVAKKRPLDASGAPLPWYTYPAIEYLRQLDFSDKSIFEYGCGNSTLFWSRRAARVVSVEDDETWHAHISQQLGGTSTTTILLEPDVEAFASAISRVEGLFDVIVVDGPTRGLTRLKCCKAARGRLSKGGVIILDNSEWLPHSAAFLRSTGLIQIDMTGFAPMNAHPSTTSLFLDREFCPTTKASVQPVHGVGALPFDYETPPNLGGKHVVIGGDTLAGVEHDERFTLASEDGVYTFRVLLYHISEMKTALAIIDEDARRIVVDGHAVAIRRGHSQTAAIEWFKQIPYERFREFVNHHPRRRYTL